MKKGLLKAGVLLLLFAAALGGTAALINREKIVGTRQMEDASLPILYMEVADTKVNPMYGYAGEMEEQYMRDSLTPLPTDRSLTMAIDPKNASVKTVSYRVSTADGTEVVETSKISKLKKKDGEIRAEFQLETPILMNQEYTLRFDVTLDNGETYYYYTRLLQRAGTNISEYLEFADSFYQTCLDPENASTLAAYLEPDETQTNSTYENLNIHSSFERITWGTLDMKLEKKAVPVIKDMNETTCSIYLTYVLSDTPEDETTDYYNVTDFYRMRYAQSRVMLLDFDRNTQELYDGKHTELTSKGIDLGVVAKDVQYQSNKSSDIVAFVQEGELWSYNRSANKTTQIFSFRDGDLDERENLQEHGVKIVRVEESGDIDFVVYGYMNRGEHEGQVGVSVCHYDCVTNTVEEMLFIPTTLSYQVVKEQLGTLMYVSDNGYFYLTISDQVYKINLDTKKTEIFISDLQPDMIVSSEDGRHIAWSEDGSVMHVTDLEKGDTYDVNAESGQTLKPLGFIGSDCIYGWGYTSDVFSTDTQTNTLALSQVLIMDFGDSEHQILKTYQSPGMYVTGIRVQDGSIYLSRVAKSGDTYTDAPEDTIMNRDMQDENLVNVSTTTSTVKQTEVVITLSTESSGTAPKQVIPKQILNEESVTIEMKNLNAFSDYYVYAKGQVIFATKDMAAAIQSADENKGVVIGKDLLYVWRRGESQTQEPLEISE